MNVELQLQAHLHRLKTLWMVEGRLDMDFELSGCTNNFRAYAGSSIFRSCFFSMDHYLPGFRANVARCCWRGHRYMSSD